MHDIRAIRENPAAFDAGLKRRGIDDQFSSAEILKLDEDRRKISTRMQDAQARRNTASKEIGAAKKAKDEALSAKLMAEVATLKDQLAADEAEDTRLGKQLTDLLAVIPNLPRDDVPDGKDEHDNTHVRTWGEPSQYNFTPKQHFEIGEALGMMDFESAAKVSGARFVFLKGPLARLERALGQFMLDTHTAAADANGIGGYMEVNPPLLVTDKAAYGTGNLPKFANDLFRVLNHVDEFDGEKMRMTPDGLDTVDEQWSEQDQKRLSAVIGQQMLIDQTEMFRPRYVQDEFGKWTKSKWIFEQYRYAIPTAEVSLTNLAREQIQDESALPQRYTACTPCFRSEAGAAGRDTRGMIRQHQFTKVELVSITTPETSLAEHDRMTNAAENILRLLKLPHRTMLLCTGDMGFSSQRTYDIEVWLPGQNAYREISSCSVCGDFQARRMEARYRRKLDGKTAYVHTLNGSGLAVGRTLVAVLENYQQADGSVVIPDVLVPYMGGVTRLAKA